MDIFSFGLFVWCGVILQALVMAEMASMYVFAKAMPTISFLFCDFCVTTHPGFGHPSAAIRTTSLFLNMVAMTLSLAPDNFLVIGQSTMQDRQFGALLQTQCALKVA